MATNPDDIFADLIPKKAGTAPIYGPPPKPDKPGAPQAIPGSKGWFLDPNTGQAFKPAGLPDAATDEDPQKKALTNAINGLGLEELLAGVRRARGAVGTGWATGVWGKIAELKPGGGTPRDDFKGYINQIQGGLINEKLQALKEASKTGASGMGALSEKEGERLASAVAAINDQMSPQALEESFREIEKHARTLQAVRDGKDPNDPAVQKLYHINETPAATGGGGGGGQGDNGGGNTPAIGRLSKQQEAAYNDFLATNPTAPQLKAYLEGLLPGQHVTNAEAILKEYQKSGRASATTENLTREQEIEAAKAARKKRGIGGDPLIQAISGTPLAPGLSPILMALHNRGADASFAGAEDTATLGLSDEINAAIDAAGQPGGFAENYAVNSAANRGNMADLQAEHPWAYGGGQAAAAIALPAGRVSSALDAAKLGAAYGGAYGFGSGEGFGGRVGGGIEGAVLGGTVGGTTAALAPFAVKALPRRFQPPRGMAPDVADAAQAEGVDLMRPMVDPHAISDYGALESNIYSQPIIRGAAARVRGQIEDRVGALGGAGQALDTGAAGDVLQTAGNRFITRSRGIKNRLYDRAEKLGGDKPVATTEAQGQIAQELAQLKEAPDTNAAEINFLEGLANDLSRPQTVGSIRRIRTSLRGQINQANLTHTSAEARALRVLDAAKTDIQRDAPAAAAAAYSRADAFNAERQTHIDTVLKQFLGKRDMPLDSEKAFARLKSLASPGGGGRNLAAMMRNLEPDERQDIAATIANTLGRDSADAPFSTAKFISQTNKLSPSARRTIFGPDGAASIDNLRLLSRRLEEAEKDINRSRSATVLERQGWRNAARAVISGIAGIGGTAATGSVAGGAAGLAAAGGAMGLSAARKVLSARAMVNPRVSRWLAETADIATRKQAENQVRKLGVIIAREPALAAELQPLHDMLAQRITQPLAAQQGDQPNEQR